MEENQNTPLETITKENNYILASSFEDYKLLAQNFYAGFWLRLIAYVVDLVVVLCITSIVNTLSQNYLNNGYELPLIKESISYAIVYFLYFVLMTYFFAQTLGKMIMKIRVEDNKGQGIKLADVLFREVVGRLLNMATFNILYIMIIFMPKKKGVHDLIADTVVVKEDFSKLRNKMNKKIEENVH